MIQAVRTYDEVARLLGLPVWQVRNIELSALAKIRQDKRLRRLNDVAKRETTHENQTHEYSCTESV